MARKNRKGVKTYRPYGIGVFLYALLALVVVGLFAGFVLLPMFSFTKEGEAPIVFKGLDYIIFSVRRFFSSLAQPKFDDFLAYYPLAGEPTNQVLAIVCKMHGLIELVIGGILGITAIWALVEALLAVGFMLFGQSAHPKSLNIFGWLTFWFFAVAIGLSYMYFFFYMQVIESTGNNVKITLSLPLLAILGGMFVICIFLFIIYKIAFKDRVAFNGKKNKHKEGAVIEEDDNAPQVIEAHSSHHSSSRRVEIVNEPVKQNDNSWTCPKCGSQVTGKFCPECGEKKPEPWACPNCGAQVKGKFCPECGTKKPEPQSAPVQEATPKAVIESAPANNPELAIESAPETNPEPVIENNTKPEKAPNLENKQQSLDIPQGSDVITVGDRAYAKNTELTSASIPEGIVSLGSSAFANCVNLATVSLPSSLQEIGFNCFFNTPKLVDVTYNGTVEMWKAIKRGSNWLTKSGTTTVKCSDGQINVNPRH